MDWHNAFDRFLPPFAEGKREKPRDMLYLASDRPPWSTTLSVSIQHVIVALMLLIYSVIAGQTMGLAGAQLRDFLALGMLVIGFGTVLNGLTTRFSAGHLLINQQGPLNITIFIAVVESSGPGAAAGGVLVYALMMLILGRFLPLLRVLFPAEVSGVLLVLLGMGLVPVGIRRATGLAAGTLNPLDPSAVLIAAVTLGTIFGLAVWSPGRARILALLIGAAAGLLMAVLTGVLGGAELARVAAQPVFALPGEYYRPAPPIWVPAAIVPYLLGSIMAAVDTVGSGVMIDKMNNERWRRPDLPMIGRLLNGLGLCHLLSAVTGTIATSISSVNLGLAHVTGVAARRAGVVTGLLLIALALLPQITAFVILLPAPIVGAILIYTAAYMMVSGAELILSRLLNARRRATVGLGLVAGTAVFMVPELTAQVPLGFKPILGSGLVVGVFCAMLLNFIFRIGVSQQGECVLDGAGPQAQATRFLEDRGADWGARREVIGRAGLAVGEALEALRTAGVMAGPARLVARFDEYTLNLLIDYPGQALHLAAMPAMDAQALLDLDQDEEAFEAAMATLSGALIRHLADRVETQEQLNRGQLRLSFNH